MKKVKLKTASVVAVVFLFAGAQSAFSESLPGKPAKEVKEPTRTPLVAKAEKVEAPKVKMLPKQIKGTVSARGVNGIAVVYDFDKKLMSSLEMWLPIDSKVKLSGYKTLKDIQEGDQIIAFYEQAEDGSKKSLKKVTLSKRKPKELEA